MIFEMRGTVSTVHLLAVFYLVQEVAMGLDIQYEQ
jgi:hypothetical protein